MQQSRPEHAALAGLGQRVARARAAATIAEARATYGDRLALVSSFGADSVVLLHLAASVDPSIPVLFIDTGRHFAETLAYVDEVRTLIGLTDLRRVRPPRAEVEQRDPREDRASYDPDGCCDLRKTRPLEAALGEFDAWISGRKRFQAQSREGIELVEGDGPRVKINPLADWTGADIEAYRIAFDLPQHPLKPQGYPSIGCAPCTSKVAEGEDPRAGRWRGFDKTECGIHFINAGEGI